MLFVPFNDLLQKMKSRNITIDEEMKISKVIACLPKEYAVFNQVWILFYEKDPKLAEVQRQVLAAESIVKKSNEGKFRQERNPHEKRKPRRKKRDPVINVGRLVTSSRIAGRSPSKVSN
jgi:hypothetical protein